MTQEDKELLLKDLCARLRYGVKVNFRSNIEVLCEVHIYQSVQTVVGERGILYDVDMPNVKPYLRPLSSMTEKERDELYTAMDWYGEIDEYGNVYTQGQDKVYRETFYEYTDWLNEHHFDYRGLIEKGLALEAPEGMYK